MKKGTVLILLCAVTAAIWLSGCGTDSADETLSSDTERVGGLGLTPVDPEDVALSLETEEVPEFSEDDVRGIAVVADGEIRYKINYTERNDRPSFLFWDMVTPYASTAVVDSEELYNIFGTMAYLNLGSGSENTVDESLDPDSFDSYITLNYYRGDDEDDSEAQPDCTLTLMIGPKEDGYYYCVLKGQEDKAMLISTDLLDAVLYEEPYDMLLKIPYLIEYSTVAEVDVTYDGSTYTMTMDEDSYTINGKEADEENYQTLYSDLMQPMLDGEIPEDAELGEDREPIVSIHYIRNMEDSVDYYIDIYSYGDGQYTVSVNGEEHFFLNADDVDTLTGAIEAGFDIK